MKSKCICIIVLFIVSCISTYGQEKKFSLGAYFDNIVGLNFGGTYYLNKKFLIQISYGGGQSFMGYYYEGRGFHVKLAYTFLDEDEDECFFLSSDLHIGIIEAGKFYFYPSLGIGLFDYELSPLCWILRDIFKLRARTIFCFTYILGYHAITATLGLEIRF